jgi:hypothetical protein
MKFETKEKKVNGVLEIGDKEFNYTAYPMGLDLMIKLAKAQKTEDQILFLELIKEYFDENIEFEKGFLNNPKEEVKQILDRSGKLVDFVTMVWDELGKQEEKKD